MLNLYGMLYHSRSGIAYICLVLLNIHPFTATSIIIMAIELEAIDDVKALPGGFPAAETCLPFQVDEIQEVARSLVNSIQKIFNGDVDELRKVYYEDGFWRDQVSLAWTFRTFHTVE